MAVSQAGVVLCNCRWVCHARRRQTGISPRFNYYIPSLPPAKVVPRNFHFIRNWANSCLFYLKFRFLCIPKYCTPDDNIYYTIRYGAETTAIRIDRVNSVKLWDPRSYLDFVHFIWSTFVIIAQIVPWLCYHRVP